MIADEELCPAVTRINLSSIQPCYQLVELKDAYPWMKEVDSQALQVSVKKLDHAFQVFFAAFPGSKAAARGAVLSVST